MVLAALLLLSTGCESSRASGAGVDGDPPPTPAPTASAPAPTATLTAPRQSNSRSSGAAPARPAPAAPAVPQYRATLAPAEKERPVPARFRAGSVDIDLPVIRTGVADDGRMELPGSNRDVAWYGFGSRPGDRTGTTVLAAHVDTRAEGLGPFARLRTMDRGDEITITDSAGRAHSYTVTAVDDVKKSEVEVDQLFRLDGAPELRVLTCGGPYRRATGYRDNIVVTAVPR